jgi:hypothetical protein
MSIGLVSDLLMRFDTSLSVFLFGATVLAIAELKREEKK